MPDHPQNVTVESLAKAHPGASDDARPSAPMYLPFSELAIQSTFLRNLVDSSVDGIIANDLKGKIFLYNQGAHRILGYLAKEAVDHLSVQQLFAPGTPRTILSRMRSDDYGGVGKLTRHEVATFAKDGTEIPVSLSGGLLYDEQGHEVAVFGIFRDLRELRDIQQRLMQSEKMAGLGRLAAGVAHELNNPMSGIMLFAHLVLEELGDNHPVAADLRVVIRETERCKEIVSDLLLFSQKGEARHESVDVNASVLRALDDVSKLPLWSGLEVRLLLEDGLSRIWGDSVRFGQVIVNLLVNAAQALAGPGCVTISSHHRQDGDIVELEVTDNGPGITPDIQGKIFDPFFTTKAAAGGTGLGLSLVYAIVKEHKGTIRVESAPGGGATFRLRIPAMHLAFVNHDET